MKENIKPVAGKVILSKSEISFAVIKHLLMALLGFASTKVSVNGLMIPFGLSFAAGIGKTFFPSVATGVFIGYFFPVIKANAFRYIASLFAIIAIKLMVFPYSKISNNPLFLGLIALLSSGITNTLTLTGNPKDTALFFCESFLAAGATYFFCVADKGLNREQIGLSTEEMVSLIITVSIILSGLFRFNIYGISIGKILAVLLILITSKFGGILSGAISGISLSAATLISGSNIYTAIAFSLAGLVSGVFGTAGKYIQGASFTVSFIICVTLGKSSNLFPVIAECILGSVLYFVLPKQFSVKLGKIFAFSPNTTEKNNIKNGVNIRLNMAADALKQVSKTTEKVSKELTKINTPNFSEILDLIENDTCNGCANKTLCWETKRKFTSYAIKDITKGLNNVPPSNEDNLTDLKQRCHRYHKLYENTVKRYSDYSNSLVVENRVQEVRDVVCSQLLGISDMLFDLSKDFSSGDIMNNKLANKIAGALKNININATEVFAKTNKFGHTYITIKLKSNSDTVINKRQIMKLCSAVSGTKFDIPNVQINDDFTYITLCEHANYRTEIGVDSISSKKDQISGDAFNFFNDGQGHTVMVLSDGMGTGGRAAVDGTMASGLMSELIKAGFGYSCALRLLNSSMLFKSSDESLATLDIATIDLFSGEISLYKAGAAPTIIRRSGRCGKAESTSLPVGILNDISFDTATVKLSENDIVLLVSDGVLCDGIEWIKAELQSFRDGTAQDLAEHICLGAKKRQQSGNKDDITVMAAILNKAI